MTYDIELGTLKGHIEINQVTTYEWQATITVKDEQDNDVLPEPSITMLTCETEEEAYAGVLNPVLANLRRNERALNNIVLPGEVVQTEEVIPDASQA